MLSHKARSCPVAYARFAAPLACADGTLGDLTWARLLASPCRTHDPAEATLFFVPHPFRHDDVASNWWPSPEREHLSPLCTHLAASLGRWRAPAYQLNVSAPSARSSGSSAAGVGSSRRVSYMERRNGRDHFIVAPYFLWATPGACEVGFGGRPKVGLLGDATRVAIDGGPHTHYTAQFADVHNETLHNHSRRMLPMAPGDERAAPLVL
jgi:hypothetical protein